MATPVEYTSQYIPTNVGLMKGMLDERQAEYDTGYAAPLMFEQEFSQLPVTGNNMAGKQAVLGNFQNKVKEIVDRYGGDYGAASKDIARTIAKEKQNPFYQLAPQHAAMAEEARKYKQALGLNALIKKDVPSSFVDEKGNITTTDFSYDISDIRDFEKPITQMFKEESTAHNKSYFEDAGNGYLNRVQQTGARDANEAAQILQSERGQNMLQQAYSLYGMNPGENPNLDAYIQTMAMGNLIGSRKENLVQDLDEAAARRSASKSTPTTSTGSRMIKKPIGYGRVYQGSTTGRNKKRQVDATIYAESNINHKLNQEVKNHTTEGKTYVFGSTGTDKNSIEGITKDGSASSTPVNLENATLQGYFKMPVILDVVGETEKTRDELASMSDEERAKDYNTGSLVTRDTSGKRDSSLGINVNDKGTEFFLDDENPHIIVNMGTEDQMRYNVSINNMKRYAAEDGRIVYEETSRPETIEAWGTDSGDPLIRLDQNGVWSNKNMVEGNADSAFRTLEANTSDTQLRQMYKGIYGLMRQGIPMNNLPEDIIPYVDQFINDLEAAEVSSYNPITAQDKFTSQAY